jgi:hypothetical protein
MPQFIDAGMGINDQSKGIIHEAAHKYLSLDDTGYFASGQSSCIETQHPNGVFDAATEASGTEGDSPSLRLRNADAYGCFVHFLTHETRQMMNARVEDFRGDNLRIVVHTEGIEGHVIYTDTDMPFDPSFIIGGVPVTSGFKFRWYLQVDSRLFSLSSRDTGHLAFEFDERNREVNADRNLRNILQNNGITSGDIVCEIQLFSPYGTTFPSPVITKRLPVIIRNGRDPVNI